MQTNSKADFMTMVLSPNRQCWSNPSSGTSTSYSDLLELSLGLILVFRATDILPPCGFNQTSGWNDCYWHGLRRRRKKNRVCGKGFMRLSLLFLAPRPPPPPASSPTHTAGRWGSCPNAFVDTNSSEACEAATLNQREEGEGTGKSENESGRRRETREELDTSLEGTIVICWESAMGQASCWCCWSIKCVSLPALL